MNEEEAVKKAEQASTLAFLGAVLMLMLNCGGCFMVFLALPISLWSMSLARAALAESPSELTKAYATPARNLSLVVAIFSSIWILIIVLYVMLYLGMFVMVFGMAATLPPPPPPPMSP